MKTNSTKYSIKVLKDRRRQLKDQYSSLKMVKKSQRDNAKMNRVRDSLNRITGWIKEMESSIVNFK